MYLNLIPDFKWNDYQSVLWSIILEWFIFQKKNYFVNLYRNSCNPKTGTLPGELWTKNSPEVVKWHGKFVKHGQRCWLKTKRAALQTLEKDWVTSRYWYMLLKNQWNSGYRTLLMISRVAIRVVPVLHFSFFAKCERFCPIFCEISRKLRKKQNNLILAKSVTIYYVKLLKSALL